MTSEPPLPRPALGRRARRRRAAPAARRAARTPRRPRACRPSARRSSRRLCSASACRATSSPASRRRSPAGEKLDPDLADAVAQAMKDWAIEQGATHFTHWFQPLTGLTAEKHDSFLSPTARRQAIAEFSRQGAHPERAGRLELPLGRHARDVRGPRLHRVGPDQPGVHPATNPNGATLCIPTVFVAWTGEALDKKTPLLRSMDALSTQALALLQLLGDDAPARVTTTVGPEQEYFLIDRALLRAAPRPGHRRAAPCSARRRRRASSSRTTTSARSRSASRRACSRSSTSCTSSACRSRRGTTKSRRASSRWRRSSRTRTSPPTTTSS